MSVAERAMGFVKRLVLLDDKVERLDRTVERLERAQADADARLVRLETLAGIGVPRSSYPNPQLPDRR